MGHAPLLLPRSAFLWLLACCGPAAGALADDVAPVDVRVEVSRWTPQAGRWDTGLGAFLGKPGDNLPDLNICVDDGRAPRCGRICEDSLECEADFVLPAGPFELRVVDVDVSNRSELILAETIGADEACNPCEYVTGRTPDRQATTSRVWIERPRTAPVPPPKPRCVPVSVATTDPWTSLGFALRAFGSSLRTTAMVAFMSEAFESFEGRGGRIELCRSPGNPAHYDADRDIIELSEGFGRTSNEQAVRILAEELAHSSTVLRGPNLLGPPGGAGWPEAYRDVMLDFEAEGWLYAIGYAEDARQAGRAVPLFPYFISPDEAHIAAIVADWKAVRSSTDEAVRKLVPYVRTATAMFRGKLRSYPEIFLLQGQDIANCPDAKRDLRSGIWLCER